MSSREYLDMDSSKSTSNIKFKVKNGFFVSRCTAFVLLVLFVVSILAVGLLVHFLSPASRSGGSGDVDASKARIGAGRDDKGDAIKVLDNVRLPVALKPLHYAVELQPFLPPNGNFSFAGRVQLRLECTMDTDNVTLHMKNMTVHEATVKVTSARGEGAAVAIAGFERDNQRQFFIIKLSSKLAAGHEYNVSMDFLGLLNDDMTGFYRSSYVDEAGQTRWLAVTQFEPTDARRAFPCFDEPAYKAKFDITLVRPSTMTSLSNMPIARTDDRPDGAKADVYQTTVNMSTYLLAFVVSDFASEVNNASKTRFSVWARPAAMQQVQYALDVGPKALDFFKTYFNIDFPLPKQDMIAVPDFRAGAMENWGLITYRETALLFDPKLSSPYNKQHILTIVVHELAHQWFGNLVTPKWWDDLWLNEGFASYMEYIGADHVEPSWKMLDQFIISDLMGVLELDSLESSHPVSVAVHNPDQINEIFDGISYSKGASVIRMMLNFLGEPTFRKGLTNYLQKLSFQNAEQDDLWSYLSAASMEDGSKVNVKDVMDSWTLQTGYPVVNVTRDYGSQTARLTQNRFYMVPKEREMNSERWHIPITFTTSAAKNFEDTFPRYWFFKNNESIAMTKEHGIPPENEWIIFNVRETAYHRVNYDNQNWRLLINQLDSDHKAIDVNNRAQVIDDALDLARASQLDYTVALNVTKYLTRETDYVPWASALTNFNFIDRMLRLTAAYGKWQKYVLQQVTPAYDKIGFTEKDTDSHLDKLSRVDIVNWACKSGNAECLKKCSELYAEWMANAASDPIPSAMKKSVSCYAIQNGGEAEWNFAFERYSKSNVGAEKDMMLNAMSCTEQPWILGKYLELSLNASSGIRKADSSSVFAGVASTPIGRPIAFDFLRDKWSSIKELHGSGFFEISKMVKSVTNSLNTAFELKELREFETVHRTDLGTATRSIQQAIEQTEANVIWMDRNFDVVDVWLKNNVA